MLVSYACDIAEIGNCEIVDVIYSGNRLEGLDDPRHEQVYISFRSPRSDRSSLPKERHEDTDAKGVVYHVVSGSKA